MDESIIHEKRYFNMLYFKFGFVFLVLLLLKMALKTLKPWFVQWSFFVWKLEFFSVNITLVLAFTPTFLSSLVLPTWIYWASYRNRWVVYASLAPLGRCFSEFGEFVPYPSPCGRRFQCFDFLLFFHDSWLNIDLIISISTWCSMLY